MEARSTEVKSALETIEGTKGIKQEVYRNLPEKSSLENPSEELEYYSTCPSSPIFPHSGSDSRFNNSVHRDQDDISPSRYMQPGSKVVHRIEYRHTSSKALIFEEEADRFAPSKPPPEQPVLEVVTTLFTTQDRSLSRHRHDKAKPPLVHSIGYTYVQINSRAVTNALRAVVEYYPGQNLAGDSIKIQEPYLILVHHEQELRQYRDSFRPLAEGTDPEICEAESDTHEHLGIVLDFMQQHTLKGLLDKERARHAQDPPVATYDMLWTLFKPGVDVYYDIQGCGNLDSYVVKSINWTVNNETPVRYEITLWNLDYDGIYIGPREAFATILPFDGEREIESLALFPCEYLQGSARNGNHEQLKENLEERGRMFFKLTSKQCVWYDGSTTTFPRQQYTGPVMVDTESYWTRVHTENSGTKMRSLLSEDIGERAPGGIPNCFCKRCRGANGPMKKPKFADYIRINPLTVRELTPHQRFLCDRTVIAFVMKVRSWKPLDVSYFSDPKFDSALIDELVLPLETRTLLKRLSKKYAREDPICNPSNQEQRGSEFNQNIGQGIIFLLHGKPGVGKTHTAECIANYTKRPLLSLTCSDLGTNPLVIESKLTYWFKLAKHWEAILLIDEADIYMEQRRASDLERNNLVAGFLRAMEYYQGILFLTTNRVGTFDEALISRIHVSVHYPDFSDINRAEVWVSFFRKLEREGGRIRIMEDAKAYVTQSPEVKAVKWNGREIRNAFQTAVLLAEADNTLDDEGHVMLKVEHIRSIVRMSSSFKRYLRILHGDEAMRAARQGLRVDDFESESGRDVWNSHYM